MLRHAQRRAARTLLWCLLLGLAAVHGAVAAAAGAAASTCSSSGSSEAGGQCQPADEVLGAGFPSGNAVKDIGGRELQELLAGLARVNGTLQATAAPAPAAVVLFHLSNCPNSIGMRQVYECLPAWFPRSVPFVAVEYRNLSLMALMGHGLHALPVLQVSTQGKRYRYSGRHWLEPMVGFLASALGSEPLASADKAAACTADRALCGGWACARTDGEATSEELAAAQHAPLFYISLAFLVGRLMWAVGWRGWRGWRRSRRAAPAARGPGGAAAAAHQPGAAAAPASVAGPAASAAAGGDQQPARAGRRHAG